MRVFKCSFCGEDIQIGKGLTYFKIDGTPLHFCSSKCKKSLLLYNRKPRRVKWTKHYPRQAQREVKSNSNPSTT